MPAPSPTWTDERIALLRQHFEAGLSCREIAADIGVSRNAVIGKLSRLNLTRGRTSDERRLPDKSFAPARASKAVPRLQYEMLATIYGETERPVIFEPIDEANRCSLMELGRIAAAGRSQRLARPISASAAMSRPTASPIAPATAASPIGRIHARASSAAKANANSPKLKTSGRALPEVSGGLA